MDRDLTHTELAAAEERLLEDVDLYTDWLYGECFGKRASSGYVPRDPVELQALIDSATVPRLVALLLYPGAASQAAAWELRQRFTAAQAEYIVRQASEVAA